MLAAHGKLSLGSVCPSQYAQMTTSKQRPSQPTTSLLMKLMGT